LIWGAVANEVFDYMLKKHQTNAQASVLVWPKPIEMDNAVSEDIWDGDGSPLMQAWDDV
jgi:hypothetical protein